MVVVVAVVVHGREGADGAGMETTSKLAVAVVRVRKIRSSTIASDSRVRAEIEISARAVAFDQERHRFDRGFFETSTISTVFHPQKLAYEN